MGRDDLTINLLSLAEAMPMLSAQVQMSVSAAGNMYLNTLRLETYFVTSSVKIST